MHFMAVLSLPDQATAAPALDTLEPGCRTTPSLEVLRWTSVQRICGCEANGSEDRGRGTAMDCGFYGGLPSTAGSWMGALAFPLRSPSPRAQALL